MNARLRYAGLAADSHGAKAAAETAGAPLQHRAPALDVDEHAPPVNLAPVALLVGRLHVPLVLELDEAVATRLARLSVAHDLARLDRAELFERLHQRGLRRLVCHPCNEERLVRVARPDLRILARLVLLDLGLDFGLVRLLLDETFACATFFRLLDHNRCSWRWRLRRVLKLLHVLCDRRVRWHLALLYRRLVLDRRPRGEEGQYRSWQGMRDGGRHASLLRRTGCPRIDATPLLLVPQSPTQPPRRCVAAAPGDDTDRPCVTVTVTVQTTLYRDRP